MRTLSITKGGRKKVIDDAAMNGPATSSVIDVRHVSRIKIQLKCTRDTFTDAYCTVTECHEEAFGSSDVFDVAETKAGGATADAVFTVTTSASLAKTVGLDVSLFDWIKLEVGGTSAGASDKADVWITGVNV